MGNGGFTTRESPDARDEGADYTKPRGAEPDECRCRWAFGAKQCLFVRTVDMPYTYMHLAAFHPQIGEAVGSNAATKGVSG
jgi:hypothetical protein